DAEAAGDEDHPDRPEHQNAQGRGENTQEFRDGAHRLPGTGPKPTLRCGGPGSLSRRAHPPPPDHLLNPSISLTMGSSRENAKKPTNTAAVTTIKNGGRTLRSRAARTSTWRRYISATWCRV